MSEVFVSYSRKDGPLVLLLAGALREDGHRVTLDQDIIQGGQLWRSRIVEAIDRADVVLVVLSSSAVDSDEVRKELDIAADTKKAVVPAALERVKVPKEMVHQLAGLHIVDLDPIEGEGGERLKKAVRTAVKKSQKDIAPLLSLILPGDWQVDVGASRIIKTYRFSIEDTGEFRAEWYVGVDILAGNYEGTWKLTGKESVRFEDDNGRELFRFRFDVMMPRELRGTVLSDSMTSPATWLQTSAFTKGRGSRLT